MKTRLIMVNIKDILPDPAKEAVIKEARRQRQQESAYVRTDELRTWVEPDFDKAARFLRVRSQAAFKFKRGSDSYTTYNDPASIRFSRTAFRQHYLAENRKEARQTIVHELLHGLGMRHDYRLGYYSAHWRDKVGEVAAKVIFNGGSLSEDEADLAARVWAKVRRIRRKQSKERKAMRKLQALFKRP